MTLKQPSPPADEALRVCDNCGAWVRVGRARCPWCGAEQDGDPTEQDVPQDDPLVPLFLIDEQAPPVAAEEPADLDSERRSARFWVGLFLLSAIVVALALVAFGALGVYQGLRDRDVLERQQAIAYYDKGQQLMQQGRYELAAAAFREATRLEPDFEAARQALAAAEAAQAGTPVPAGILATPVRPAQQAEQLWQEAQQALAAGRWEEAANALEILRSLDPTFRRSEIETLLFDTHMRAGIAARDRGDFTTAVRHFDQALAIRPDAEDALHQRQLASAYRSGVEAAEREDWERATTEFRRVYLIDPDYLDISQRLAEAHLRYGDEFWQRDIWCEAAQQYRAALALTADAEAEERLPAADQRCQQRVLATPIPHAGGAGEGLETPEVLPTDTPLSSPYPFVLDGNVGEDFGLTCTGHSIRGVVRDATGRPVAGVTVRAVDEWGNVYSGVSKEDPPGGYDIPINSNVTTYQVSVVADDAALSATVAVRHTERFAQQQVACHILNWVRLPPSS